MRLSKKSKRKPAPLKAFVAIYVETIKNQIKWARCFGVDSADAISKFQIGEPGAILLAMIPGEHFKNAALEPQIVKPNHVGYLISSYQDLAARSSTIERERNECRSHVYRLEADLNFQRQQSAQAELRLDDTMRRLSDLKSKARVLAASLDERQNKMLAIVLEDL